MPRDDFTETTKRTLCHRVGGRCSNPSCRAITIGPNSDPLKVTKLGEAAHITAAAKGGPRYDASLTPEQRKSIENGIWLCNKCATEIDADAERFPADLLRKWKKQAEEYQKALIEGRALENMKMRAKDALIWISNIYQSCEEASLSADRTLSPENPEVRWKNYSHYLTTRNKVATVFLSEAAAHQDLLRIIDRSDLQSSLDLYLDGLDKMIEQFIHQPDTSEAVERNNELFLSVKRVMEEVQKNLVNIPVQ